MKVKWKLYKIGLLLFSMLKTDIAQTYLRLPLRQRGADNVYLLVWSSWKVNIAENCTAEWGCRLGWAPWNLSCLEFKFDDTRLSYWHKNKIGGIEIFFLLLPDFANFLPSWPAQFWWDSQQGRELAKSGSNKKKFQFCQSYSCVNRKVRYTT